jgi:adenosyl cobinamide kinase/adenosyl cobinamide phosphate guanylyltransferase
MLFKSPFTLICVGATSSGKSQWVKKLIDNKEEMIEPAPAHVLYCYGEINQAVMEHKQRGVEIFHGIPEESVIRSKQKPLLLILDDLMLDIDSSYLDLLFTRGSHNWNVSIIFVTQSLFGRNIRTARANAHYLVLMRNPQAQQNIRTVGSQLFPGLLKYFMESYKDATENRYSYLLVDMHPNTSDEHRLSTNIFPGEKEIYYLPI